MVDGKSVVEEMRRMLAQPTTYEELEAFVKTLPARWRVLPPEHQFERLRCMVAMTQDQVAKRTGLHQSAVSKLEGGRDSKLSTWRKAYDAMGYELVLLPVPRADIDELRRRAGVDRATRRWWRQHARPRRRWKEDYAERRREKAEREAARAAREEARAARGTLSAGPATAPSDTPPGPSSPRP